MMPGAAGNGTGLDEGRLTMQVENNPVVLCCLGSRSSDIRAREIPISFHCLSLPPDDHPLGVCAMRPPQIALVP